MKLTVDEKFATLTAISQRMRHIEEDIEKSRKRPDSQAELKALEEKLQSLASAYEKVLQVKPDPNFFLGG